jgi:hypothetical protein
MSLSNYTELKQAIKDFLHRTDLDGTIPTFITLAESRFNKRLRTRWQEQRATATLNSQYLDLPTDFLAVRNIQLNSDPLRTLVFMSPLDIDIKYGSRTGIPEAYTFVADEFQFAPVPSGDYTVEIDYYKRIPALSDDAATNWLLTNYPDVYLAGAMVEAMWFTQDGGQLAAWRARLEESLKELDTADLAGRWGGAGMSVKPDIAII